MSRTYVGPVAVALLGSFLTVALAQVPAPPAAPAAAPTAPGKPADPAGGSPTTGPLAPLAWLHGCWEGNVNQRAFREEWLPLVGDRMVGVSQTTLRGKTVDFEYLRLEPRPDGVFYVAAPAGKDEAAFRLVSQTTVDAAEVFTFVNATRGVEYPQRIIYRRGSEGWLYATVEGKIKGVDKQVIFPMRRVDCQTGATAGN
ncbi:MAG TPA: DUF6265 family protein [Casimicrobiaceae bacterium]|jgi:hypothetical protein